MVENLFTVNQLVNLDLPDVEYIDSGIAGINGLVGGYCRGEVTLLCAASSGGKSLVSINSAIMMASKNLKVLYLSCENSMSDDVKRIKNIIDRYKLKIEDENFLYLNNDNENITFDALAKLTDELDNLDAVFLDSVDFINVDAKDGTDLYNAYGQIMTQLRTLARSQNIAIISTSQLVREASIKDIQVLNQGDIANSIRLARIAHDVWVISKYDNWSMKIVKNRGQLRREETIFSMPDLDITVAWPVYQKRVEKKR